MFLHSSVLFPKSGRNDEPTDHGLSVQHGLRSLRKGRDETMLGTTKDLDGIGQSPLQIRSI